MVEINILNLIWFFSSRFIEKLRFSRNRLFDPIMEVIETNMESDVSKRKDIDKVKKKKNLWRETNLMHVFPIVLIKGKLRVLKMQITTSSQDFSF